MKDKFLVKYYKTCEFEKVTSLSKNPNDKYFQINNNIKYNMDIDHFNINDEILDVISKIVSSNDTLTVGLPIFRFDEKTYSVGEMIYSDWKNKFENMEGVYILYSFNIKNEKIIVRGCFIED